MGWRPDFKQIFVQKMQSLDSKVWTVKKNVFTYITLKLVLSTHFTQRIFAWFCTVSLLISLQ